MHNSKKFRDKEETKRRSKIEQMRVHNNLPTRH